ncbi:tetratricopeptide repeat-containing sensor histidine kinase [Flavilitoribacter nigricans]|uniref:histidine kinase n=1 Tax=Flavilitoribacter nigricans (strain ATCC 23147 / DSM 23189 / NBRC 102662 / NCIMB 1420 / SS-2) TaxID=1122177 RepID=A0A2D0N9B3_FLAN2|nr:histidine kinase dimerization/phosphoacceptor domain -containing protein [Flavilitoribacter nigricans]PHN04960.1 hypothetical protein CRP01_18185 [Flavilitoribacter nigricans DSM 23189 = NBRC 102662]
MRILPILFSLLGIFRLSAQSDSLDLLPLDSVFTLLKNDIYNTNEQSGYEAIYGKAFRALERAQETGDPEKTATAHGLLALWHYYSVSSNNPDSSYFHFHQSLEYFKQTDDQLQIAKAHDRVGKSLIELGRYKEAEQQLFEVIRIFENLNMPQRLGSAYASLNYLYRETKDYEQALIYGEKSLVLFEENPEEEEDLIEPLLGLIKTYPEVGQAERALEKAQQVVDIIARAHPEEYNVHMANVRVWRGEVYVALEEYDKALDDFYYSWEAIKRIVPSEEDANGWKGYIGNVLRLQRKYAEAIPYIKDCLVHHLERNIQASDVIEDNQFWLAECYENTNQPDSALLYLSQAQTSQNNRLTGELAAVKNELRIKYDTDQKEETINSQQATIEQQAKIQYLSFGVGGLLLALLGGGLFSYRNNHQKNRQLQLLNKDLVKTNQQLDERNAQNELLLKEIHHRVKNNLDIVSSLLELQSRQTKDKVAQSAMKESQSRVKSMGILHQKLFQGKNLVAIEMKDYFQKLSGHLLDAFDASEKVEVDFPMEPLELDVDTALPIGLIVNELMTNALKYAFPETANGRINLSLKSVDEQYLDLSIEDNGVGKLSEISSNGTGFGSQLVSLLTRQLEGVMKEYVANGTRISFRLKRVNPVAFSTN